MTENQTSAEYSGKAQKSRLASLATGSASGCVIWVLGFFVSSMCLCPVAAAAGALTSTLQADFVAKSLESYLCPDNSRAEIVTFETTMQDSAGTARPATGYEMQCVDAEGSIVKGPGPEYAFYWTGLLTAVGLLLSGLMAVALATPAGALIARLSRRSHQT